MKNALLILLGSLLLLSCKPDKEAETVDFNDISKPSDKYREGDSTRQTIVTTGFFIDSLEPRWRQFTDSMHWDKKTVFGLDTVIFPDRFGAAKSHKFYCKTLQDSVVFMHWQFRDSIQAQNAFFNWMDCYGKRCKSVRIGEETNLSPRASFFLLQNKELIFAESRQKINFERYLEILESLKFEKQWKYLVIQAPKGKAKWNVVDPEGKISKLEVNPVQNE
jgi:hypothetical protein